jgi:hypothetical protein
MAEVDYKVLVGNNFTVEHQVNFSDIKDQLKMPGVYYDERANILSLKTDLTNWNWYFNYLDFQQVSSVKHAEARPTYLLDLGYVPVAYLPSCFVSLGAKIMEALDVSKIPYIKLSPTSFALKYCNIMTVDAWVHKMDVADMLDKKPEDVTSKDILRRLFVNE